MTFEPTKDYSSIKAILTSPRIWRQLRDDFSGEPKDYEPTEQAGYVLAKDGDEILGLFIFRAENPACWYVDFCILPCAYGERGLQAACELREWIWEKTPCRRLVGAIARSNRLAIVFAQRVGMTQWGVNEKSVLHRGRLEDRVLVGISKPE